MQRRLMQVRQRQAQAGVALEPPEDLLVQIGALGGPEAEAEARRVYAQPWEARTLTQCLEANPNPHPHPNPNLNPNPNPNLNPNPNPSQACQLLKDPCNLHCSPAVCVRDGLCEWAEQKSWCEAANFTVTVVPDRLSGPVESALRCNPTLYVKGAR